LGIGNAEDCINVHVAGGLQVIAGLSLARTALVQTFFFFFFFFNY